MGRIQLWLLSIAFFVAAMLLAFTIGGLARRARTNAKPQLDPELAVAIETARRTLPKFIVKLQKPGEPGVAFAIKASFVESGHAEMMWVDHLTYSTGAFDGVLADSPVAITTLHRGDHVHVAEASVVDWEVLHHTPTGDLHEGAETDRVLRSLQANHTLRYPPRMPSSKARLA